MTGHNGSYATRHRFAALVHGYELYDSERPQSSRKMWSVGHTPLMRSRVHPKYKTRYRVSNWAEYDRALVQRGEITLWISEDAISSWKPAPTGPRGGRCARANQSPFPPPSARPVFRRKARALRPGPSNSPASQSPRRNGREPTCKRDCPCKLKDKQDRKLLLMKRTAFVTSSKSLAKNPSL